MTTILHHDTERHYYNTRYASRYIGLLANCQLSYINLSMILYYKSKLFNSEKEENELCTFLKTFFLKTSNQMKFIIVTLKKENDLATSQ